MERRFRVERRAVKMKLLIAGLALTCGISAQAGSFSNLNFEAYSGSGTNLLPGWERSEGAYDWPLMDDCPLVTAGLGLYSGNGGYACGTLFQGAYSAFFSSGIGIYVYDEEADAWVYGDPGTITIWQTAQVPVDATTIRYSSTPTRIQDTDLGHFEMRIQGMLGGIDLSAGTPEELGNGGRRYTTDISSWAGQTVQLSFYLSGSENPENPGTWHSLDEIEFLNASGTVVWPPQPPICLEDFHAGTLNTSLWEVATVGPAITYGFGSYNGDGFLRNNIYSATTPFETSFRYRSLIRGDWDVRMDFKMYFMSGTTGTGIVGMALGADFGEAGTSKASVGCIANANGSDPRYMMDWGEGPTDTVTTTLESGIFRLVRTGWEVAGYIWDAGSNHWQMVGTADGYTDDTARVGLKVWSTGAVGGKGWWTFSDNLMLANGQVSLEGMAIKVFGLDESGAPTVAWDAGGIAETNRYYVTKATSLVDSVWTPVSGAIGESGGETNWTGTGGGTGPAYYRIEVAPSAPAP